MSSEEPGAAVAVREQGAEVEARKLPPPENNGVMHPDRWTMFTRIAKTVAKTEFVPKAIRNNEAAVMACLLFGDSLGLHPSVSLTEVHVIDGRPGLSAALMTGKIRAAGHRIWREEIRDEQGSFLGCTAHGQRSDGEKDSFSFTLEMSKRAGLDKKDNHSKYPEAMCWARAASQLARMLFSDVFQGQATYTPEELEESGGLVNGGEPGAAGEAAGEADYGDDPELAAALRAHYDALGYLPAKRTLLLEGASDEVRRSLLKNLEREAEERGVQVVVPEPEVAGEVVGEEDEPDPEDELERLDPAAQKRLDELWDESGGQKA